MRVRFEPVRGERDYADVALRIDDGGDAGLLVADHLSRLARGSSR